MSDTTANPRPHGHVTPNADGYLARCGGPKICKVCKAEQEALKQPCAGMGERKAFEAHMRVGGYSNPDKHPDGSYVSSAMELWWQGWKARAKLPSLGGGVVAELSSDEILMAFEENGFRIEPGASFSAKGQIAQLLNAVAVILSTHPADQVAEPGAELVELLAECRGIVAREVERWNRVAAFLLEDGKVESSLLARLDAKLASLKPKGEQCAE